MVRQTESGSVIDSLAEAIESFMSSVPGNPSEGERDWSSEDMAKALLPNLANIGCVKLSEDQEMPHITHEIAELASELVKAGADVFTAGAGGMWEAIQRAGFRKVESFHIENECEPC